MPSGSRSEITSVPGAVCSSVIGENVTPCSVSRSVHSRRQAPVRHRERQVVQPRPALVEQRAVRVGVLHQRERDAEARATQERLPQAGGAVVPADRLEPQHPLVPRDAAVHVGDGERDVVNTGQRGHQSPSRPRRRRAASAIVPQPTDKSPAVTGSFARRDPLEPPADRQYGAGHERSGRGEQPQRRPPRSPPAGPRASWGSAARVPPAGPACPAAACRPVFTSPGATALTRTPSAPTSMREPVGQRVDRRLARRVVHPLARRAAAGRRRRDVHDRAALAAVAGGHAGAPPRGCTGTPPPRSRPAPGGPSPTRCSSSRPGVLPVMPALHTTPLSGPSSAAASNRRARRPRRPRRRRTATPSRRPPRCRRRTCTGRAVVGRVVRRPPGSRPPRPAAPPPPRYPGHRRSRSPRSRRET